MFRSLINRSNYLLNINKLYNKCLRKCHSMPSEIQKTVTFSNGRTLGIGIDSGQWAGMADGSAVVTAGDTEVMVVAISREKTKTSSCKPLTVDYMYDSSVVGGIADNCLHREIGRSDEEILTSELINSSVKPLFPKGISSETQLVCNILSVDSHNDPDLLAINGSSAALTLSDIPWNGPIGAVRVSLMADNELITCPTREEMSEAVMTCVLSVNALGNVLMLEAFANQPVLESSLIKSLKKAVKKSKLVIESIKSLEKTMSKPKRETEPIVVYSEDHYNSVKKLIYAKVWGVFTDYSHDKRSRDEALERIQTEALEQLKEKYGDDYNESMILSAIHHCLKNIYSEVN